MSGVRSLAGAALVAALAVPAPAHAETSGVASTGFVITVERDVNAPREQLWTAITRLPAWWNGKHSYSGIAANFTFDVRAGGCWCEQWDGGSVLHGTVANVSTGRLLRLYASLGPLQDRATAGVLTFATTVVDGRTKLKMTYKVAGPADAGLVELAPVVDRVMTEAVDRLVAFAENGKAD